MDQSNRNFQHAEFLLSAIEGVLKAQNIWYCDLDLVATCKGPGSFSGVRVALSIAKSIKISTNIDVIAFDSSQILAYSYLKNDMQKVYVILKASFNEFYIASYEVLGKEFVVSNQVKIISQDQVKKIIPCGSKVIGNVIDKKFAKEIDLVVGQKVDFDCGFGSQEIGALAIEQVRLSRIGFYKNLEPIYFRSPV